MHIVLSIEWAVLFEHILVEMTYYGETVRVKKKVIEARWKGKKSLRWFKMRKVGLDKDKRLEQLVYSVWSPCPQTTAPYWFGAVVMLRMVSKMMPYTLDKLIILKSAWLAPDWAVLKQFMDPYVHFGHETSFITYKRIRGLALAQRNEHTHKNS